MHATSRSVALSSLATLNFSPAQRTSTMVIDAVLPEEEEPLDKRCASSAVRKVSTDSAMKWTGIIRKGFCKKLHAQVSYTVVDYGICAAVSSPKNTLEPG